MTRFQQIGVGLVALVLIYLLTPGAPQQVISSAPGLSSSFKPVGAQAVFAAVLSASPGALSVLGQPSITVAQIEAVLDQYQSPAKGSGQDIYDLGVQYGIDPAIMLAFFIHESGAGSNLKWAGRKPDGSTTHNVGNITCTGSEPCYGRFRDYGSWREGIEDWYKLIRELYIGHWQRSTVEQIIPKYAPSSDNNDEGAYIEAVRRLVQSWRGAGQ